MLSIQSRLFKLLLPELCHLTAALLANTVKFLSKGVMEMSLMSTTRALFGINGLCRRALNLSTSVYLKVGGFSSIAQRVLGTWVPCFIPAVLLDML